VTPDGSIGIAQEAAKYRHGRRRKVMRPLEAPEPAQPLGEPDPRALDRLFVASYEELRRLAASVRRRDPSVTLNPTALVNEAWLKLSATPGVAATSRLHFKRIAARAMRQVLVEAARRRNSEKRGGGALAVTFDDALAEPNTRADELLSLDGALEALASLSPRQAAIVESRFFGGLTVSETAELMQLSEATVLRDWRAARAWLAGELRGSGAEPRST
jgi:RNA polymerase sigma factor (TIGR02999 family)